MDWWTWVVIGVLYFSIGSIGAKVVDKYNLGEGFDFIGSSLRDRVETTMFLLFCFWLPFLVVCIVVAPFYGLYNLIGFVFDKVVNYFSD